MTDTDPITSSEPEPGPIAEPDESPKHKAESAKAPRVRRVSVVYFHGIGEQRRLEEVSRLIDGLDTYAGNSLRKRGQPIGKLARIRPRLEPRRTSGIDTKHDVVERDDVTYIRADYIPPRPENKSPKTSRQGPATTCKFYEVYWAHLMAPGPSSREVLVWLFSKILRPLRTLRSVWRDRQRLRRATLLRMRDRADAERLSSEDYRNLASSYDKFEGPAARRTFPTGTFDEFLSFMKQRFERNPEKDKRVRKSANDWYRHYRRTEYTNLCALLTIGLALVTTTALVLLGLVQLLQLIVGSSVPDLIAELGFKSFADAITPSFASAIALFVSLAVLLGLTRFLRRYLGDVLQWTTYEETHERHRKRLETLSEGANMLQHVLADEECDQVIVVGHSLGTAVAHDSLLELTRHNRARNAQNPIEGPIPLGKINIFVSMGSPIDKLHYLFESFRSEHHRYNRVVDELRGDVGEPPFAKNGKPHAHWVNFWDTGDVISGPLYSPANRHRTNLTVDNVHVSSLHFPFPGRSHSAYFRNREVIARLYEMIFQGEYRYQSAKRPSENEGYDYQPLRIGPGTIPAGPRRWLRLVMLVPWMLALNILLRVVGCKGVVIDAADLALAVLLAVLVIGAFAGSARGLRSPI